MPRLNQQPVIQRRHTPRAGSKKGQDRTADSPHVGVAKGLVGDPQVV